MGCTWLPPLSCTHRSPFTNATWNLELISRRFSSLIFGEYGSQSGFISFRRSCPPGRNEGSVIIIKTNEQALFMYSNLNGLYNHHKLSRIDSHTVHYLCIQRKSVVASLSLRAIIASLLHVELLTKHLGQPSEMSLAVQPEKTYGVNIPPRNVHKCEYVTSSWSYTLTRPAASPIALAAMGEFSYNAVGLPPASFPPPRNFSPAAGPMWARIAPCLSPMPAP